MKKEIITLLALVGGAVASDADITLLYGMDFKLPASGGVSYENVALNPGTGLISTVGTGFHNYITGMDDSKAADVRATGSSYQITAASDSTTGLGVNTTDGFTLTFNAKYHSNAHWNSFLAFNIGGQELVFQWGDGINRNNSGTTTTSLSVFTYSNGGSVSTGDTGLSISGIDADWHNVALVAKKGTLTLSAYDSSANLINTCTVNAKYTGTLNSVSGRTDYKFVESSYIDNMAIYDGALTNDQLIAVTKYEMKNQTVMQSIPEPTTATLSLLALAGLATRRRRK